MRPHSTRVLKLGFERYALLPSAPFAATDNLDPAWQVVQISPTFDQIWALPSKFRPNMRRPPFELRALRARVSDPVSPPACCDDAAQGPGALHVCLGHGDVNVPRLWTSRCTTSRCPPCSPPARSGNLCVPSPFSMGMRLLDRRFLGKGLNRPPPQQNTPQRRSTGVTWPRVAG